MNQIYRVVFNTLTGAWQAVSEIARGRSRSAHTAQPAALARRPRRPLFQATAVLAAALSTCGIAQAAEQYWDGSNTTNTTIDGGNGTWTTLYENWNNADGTHNSMWNLGNTAIFQGTAGTVTLDGAQTASGLTFRTTGYVLEGSALELTTSPSTAGAAVVTVDPNVTATLNMALTGPNSVLKKSGAGTLVLNGINTYSGATLVNAGTLAIGAGGSLSSTTALNVAGSATFKVSGATTAQAVGSLAGAGSVVLGSTGLSVGGNHASTSFSGVVSGDGSLTKAGTGTWTLAGNSSGFAGNTLVASGSLLLAGTGQLGGTVTVASGASLAGTGTVGSAGTTTTVQSGAVIATGDASTPYGPLHVAGNLTLEQGATYQVQADPASQSSSSRITVAGTATLAGSVLHVGKELNAATDFQVGKTYTILQAQGIVGQFGAHTSSYAYLDTALGYTATDVTLQLQRKNSGNGNGNGSMRFADLAATTNQASVANSIESLGRGNPLFDHIETLPAGAPAAAFNSLSGDMHASVAGSLGALTAQAASLGQQRLHNNLTAGYRPGAAIAQSNGPLPASAWPTSKALPAWVEVVGHRQTLDGSSNAPGVKQNVYGLFLGADEEVGGSGWRVGGSLGYTNADAEVKSRDASADISSYSASVYTGKGFSHGINRINVMGGLAYTHHRIDSQRSVAGLGQNLKADYAANTLQLFGEVGYAMGQYSKQGIEPFAGINISQQRVGSFQESGGFAALRGQSSTDTTTSTTLGVRAHSDIKLAGKATRLKGTVGWRHAWGDVTQSTTMAFAGSSSFTVAGTPLARNTALMGLQAEVELSRYAALELGYQGEYGSGMRDHAVNVKMRWAY